MSISFRILHKKIKSFKFLLHVLLKFKDPTDSIVIVCSQHLDQYIVRYQGLKKNRRNHIA